MGVWLSQNVPTVRFISSLIEVNEAEWDCVVSSESLTSESSFGTVQRLASHLSFIYLPLSEEWITVDRPPDSIAARGGGHFYPEIRRQSEIIHTEFVDPREDVDEELAEAVHRFILPNERKVERHLQYVVAGSARSVDLLRPILRSPQGHLLAAWYPRSENSEGWLLPASVSRPEVFVRLALDRWHQKFEERFPRLIDWRSSPRWLTTQEQEVAAAVAELDLRLKAELEKAERERAELVARLDELALEQDEGIRRLLTATGDPLVAAVADALTRIGFDVEDMDPTRPPGQNLEDLQLLDPDEPGWSAIVEVKGLTGGASVNDLLKFSRYVEAYIQSKGRPPVGRWYVVNQFIGRDPGSRDAPLVSNPDELTTFAQSGGLVMDTTTLFDLVRSIEDGVESRGEVRKYLREARGLVESATAG